MAKKNFKDELSDVLFGVKVPSSCTHEDTLVYTASGTNPPGYMIKMVLVFLYGSRLPQGSDKSEWELPLEFKGLIFLITDFRRYRWEIYGPEGSHEAANALKKKLITAANILNKQIKKEAKAHFASDHLFIQNNYHKTLALYEYFYSAIKTHVEVYSDDNTVDSIAESNQPNIGERINLEIQRNAQIEFNLIATAIFFFALTEVLLDACFALGDRRQCTYKNFREKKWEERIKFFSDFAMDKSCADDFTDIVKIRRYYRNIPIHASPEFFFPMEGFGLIPSNYNALQDPHMLPSIGFSQEEALRVLGLFDRFLEHFKSIRVCKYACMYVEYGLSIPIHSESVAELKKSMESEERFEEEMHKRVYYQDMFDNMEI